MFSLTYFIEIPFDPPMQNSTIHSYTCIIILSITHAMRIGPTCQVGRGGCDQICTDTETGPKCSCHSGFWFVPPSNCVGEFTNLASFF